MPSKFTCMQTVCLPLPTPNMFNIGCDYKATPPILSDYYQKIIALYSGKYGIWEISYSRILPDELLVAQMNQEIPYYFSNLTSYYKPETGCFMKGETSDNKSWKTRRLQHTVYQQYRICLQEECVREQSADNWLYIYIYGSLLQILMRKCKSQPKSPKFYFTIL